MTTNPRTRRRWLHFAVGAAAVALLLLTFVAYLSPHFARDLASRLWACF